MCQQLFMRTEYGRIYLEQQLRKSTTEEQIQCDTLCTESASDMHIRWYKLVDYGRTSKQIHMNLPLFSMELQIEFQF